MVPVVIAACVLSQTPLTWCVPDCGHLLRKNSPAVRVRMRSSTQDSIPGHLSMNLANRFTKSDRLGSSEIIKYMLGHCMLPSIYYVRFNCRPPIHVTSFLRATFELIIKLIAPWWTMQTTQEQMIRFAARRHLVYLQRGNSLGDTCAIRAYTVVSTCKTITRSEKGAPPLKKSPSS